MVGRGLLRLRKGTMFDHGLTKKSEKGIQSQTLMAGRDLGGLLAQLGVGFLQLAQTNGLSLNTFMERPLRTLPMRNNSQQPGKSYLSLNNSLKSFHSLLLVLPLSTIEHRIHPLFPVSTLQDWRTSTSSQPPLF